MFCMNRNIFTLAADAVALTLNAAPKPMPPLPEYPQYADYTAANKPAQAELERQRVQLPMTEIECPLISIIIAGSDADETQLNATLVSVVAQTYAKWELIVAFGLSKTGILRFADMSHMRLVQIVGSVAEQLDAAQTEAKGGFIMRLEAGDRLAPNALFSLVQQLAANVDTDMVYADNDVVYANGATGGNGDEQYSARPFFKPDYSPEGQMCFDLVGRPLIVRASVHGAAGGFLGGGGDDFREYVRRCAMASRSVIHVARVLLGETEEAAEASVAAMSIPSVDAARVEQVSTGLFLGSRQIRFALSDRTAVTIVIPYPKNLSLLKRCVESIDTQATYRNYKLVISACSKQDTEDSLNDYLEALKRNHAAAIVRTKATLASLPRLANEGAVGSAADVYLFIDPCCEILSPDFIERLVEPLTLDGVAVCGGKLLAPDDRLYSCGTVVGLGGWAESTYLNTQDDMSDLTKCCFTSLMRNVTAVCGAFMAVDAECFVNAGLFDESFTHVGWDTELCLRLKRRQLRSVFTPFAKAKLNALPMTYDVAPTQNQVRCYDVYRQTLLAGDRYFNVNFDPSNVIPTPTLTVKRAIELNPFYS